MVKNKLNTKWNLKLLYSSINDPKIESDMKEIERKCADFVASYAGNDNLVNDDEQLLASLKQFEELEAYSLPKPLRYALYQSHLNSADTKAAAKLAQLSERANRVESEKMFFHITIGKCSVERRNTLLQDDKFAHFKVFLNRTFDDFDHTLSLLEEKIISLKNQTSYEMWVRANEKILNSKTVKWAGKALPVTEAFFQVQMQKTTKKRNDLQKRLDMTLRDVADISEPEMNAILTDKKIDDELRKFDKPYDATIFAYRNNRKVVEGLVNIVTKNFHISHRFYRLKAKLLKQKRFGYGDRSAKIGTVSKKFNFSGTISNLKEIFGKIDHKYADYIDRCVKNGQIDVFPKLGKHGGAYCSGAYNSPTFILLNHTDSFNAFTTVAHELGHAFHTELSQTQGPIYIQYSTSLAETASTLFESIAIESIYETLNDKEKIVVLHDKINDDISTIFRQIACFNFENDIHVGVRTKGYLSNQEIAEFHNRNMQAYLGPVFKLDPDDGYMFVQWSHIRRFFYVYTYAYGQLVSKALLNKYRADKTFWSKIEQFLSAGGSKSPEEILLDIGIDVSKPDFFISGLKEIEKDIDELERLTKK